MQILSRIKLQTSVIASLMILSPMVVCAESAPVYDADTLQQQFESAGSNDRDYPPPPAPGHEPASSGNVFVQTEPSPNVQAAAPHAQHLDTEQQIARLEQQINDLRTSGNAARIESLQNEIQSLRGQVEQLTRQLQQVQTQQKSMYTDLDKRLSAQNDKLAKQPVTVAANNSSTTTKVDLDAQPDNAQPATKTNRKALPAKIDKSAPADESASASNTSTTGTDVNATVKDTNAANADGGQPDVAEEQQIYQTAYNLIKAKKYDDAIQVLQKMLQKYPSGQFAANAHYWLGELFGLTSKNDQALTEFTTVVKQYPDSPRVSDAQLKVGLIYAAQMQWRDAKTAFRAVINHYPGTASARLASEQLKQIRQAGH